MTETLRVAFIWHMHQPFYKDTETGHYALPWVRLHAVKDYLHLARILRDFPDVHQTINVVPSLAEQLLDYASGNAIDRLLELSLRAAQPGVRLSDADKREILASFFTINWDHFVYPVPRYAQLARLREAAAGDIGVFSEQFWVDLIVWFNLAWIDPSLRQASPVLRALVEKGKAFHPGDILTVASEHRAMCGDVLPAYRELVRRGQVELSTSPYFHPILPLLVDTSCAREASPNLPIPRIRFASPDDARAQLAAGIEFYERTFGGPPAGLWPSEGAVSQAMVELVRGHPSIRWIATDEHVLARALDLRFGRDQYGHLLEPRAMFQPYVPSGGGPAIFFRDQTLADRVGFVYQHWNSKEGADDLVERLLHVDRVLQSDGQKDGLPPVVSIVLDGENCWEFYPNNGDDFLRALYGRIGREPRLQTTTPSEYLDLVAQRGTALRTIERVPAASWIGSNLETWIGEPDQNRAWEYLALARGRLTAWERNTAKFDSSRRARAWHAMYVAEGSDWFWWYYSRNRVGGEETFDARFREHLANIYRAIEAPVPEWLSRPIAGQPPQRERSVSGQVSPEALSGGNEASVAWANAGYVDAESSTGSMQVGARVFRRIYYGHDDLNLYVRVEFGTANRAGQLSLFVGRAPTPGVVGNPSLGSLDVQSWSHADIVSSSAFRADLPETGDGPIALLANAGQGLWAAGGLDGEAVITAAAAELRIRRSTLHLATGDVAVLAVALLRESELVEAIPTSGVVRIVLSESTPATDVSTAAAGG